MESDPQTSKSNTNIYPEPLVIQPQLPHRHTFIILHGRGSTAQKFAPPLLSAVITSGETLQTAFPHAKLICPTASRSRAVIYQRSYTHQWFDQWHLEEYEKRQDLQREGLKRSVEFIHSLLKDEIEIVGGDNVVLWGLSQGCTTSLASLLMWDSSPLAAVVGMCGYLPFWMLLGEIAGGDPSDRFDRLFVGDNEKFIF